MSKLTIASRSFAHEPKNNDGNKNKDESRRALSFSNFPVLINGIIPSFDAQQRSRFMKR
jgi:hypothetical protein